MHFAGDVVELEFEARGVSEARDVRVQCMLHGYERNNGGSLIENARPVARRASDLYQFVSIFDTRLMTGAGNNNIPVAAGAASDRCREAPTCVEDARKPALAKGEGRGAPSGPMVTVVVERCVARGMVVRPFVVLVNLTKKLI